MPAVILMEARVKHLLPVTVLALALTIGVAKADVITTVDVTAGTVSTVDITSTGSTGFTDLAESMVSLNLLAIASTSTGSARQRSSSQVMECSNARDRRSTCGTIFDSKRMYPQFGRRGLWLSPIWASAVDADEMEHGVFVDDGGLLQ